MGLFLLFSSLLLLSCFFVSITNNLVFAAFFLVLSFVNSFFLLLLLEADFIAVIFLVIYVGAIAVLFIFVIILLSTRSFTLRRNNNQVLIHFFRTLFLLFICLFFYFVDLSFNLFPFTVHWAYALDDFTNLHLIGQILYQHFFIYVLIVGLLLLISLVGPVALVFQPKTHTITSVSQPKKQQINQQFSRSIVKAVFKLS